MDTLPAELDPVVIETGRYLDWVWLRQQVPHGRGAWYLDWDPNENLLTITHSGKDCVICPKNWVLV